MRDRDKLRTYQALAEAQKLQCAAAAQTHLEATAVEETRVEQESAAKQRVEDSARAWEDCLTSGGFDPQRLGLLASALDRCEGDQRRAHTMLASAQGAKNAARVTHLEASIRSDLAAIAIKRQRRRVVRRDEEKALGRQEELAAFEWGQS